MTKHDHKIDSTHIYRKFSIPLINIFSISLHYLRHHAYSITGTCIGISSQYNENITVTTQQVHQMICHIFLVHKLYVTLLEQYHILIFLCTRSVQNNLGLHDVYTHEITYLITHESGSFYNLIIPTFLNMERLSKVNSTFKIASN